ncbi:MAG: hypothetical protein ACOCZR_00750 [Halanaerobiales bacterium]
MKDKNNNDIPDWLEFVMTYILVGLLIYFAFQNPTNAIAYLTPAAALSGLRDWKSPRG